VSSQLETAQWKSGCAYVRGRSHIKEDVPCQDRAKGMEKDGVALIALADGAGSAKCSHIGAELAIEAVSAELTAGFDEALSLQEEDIAAGWLDRILASLESTADANGMVAADYASTLLVVAVKGDSYIAGHLGDGLIAVEREELEVLSHPENGEYANSTYFTTSRDAEARLRIYRGNVEDIKAFFLMSDGTAAAMHRRTDDTLAPALKTISGWFMEHSVETIEQALHQNLEQVIKNKTFDDCSIAVMRRID